MKPPSFDYTAPASVAEAVSVLNDFDGEAKILAGGQSLMPLLNMRLARPGIADQDDRLAPFDIRATHQLADQRLVDRRLRLEIEVLKRLDARKLGILQPTRGRSFLAFDQLQLTQLQQEAPVVDVLSGAARQPSRTRRAS